LKALGREYVDRKVIEGIRQQLESKECERILRDTRSVTGWIYETIKRICVEGVVNGSDGAVRGALIGGAVGVAAGVLSDDDKRERERERERENTGTGIGFITMGIMDTIAISIHVARSTNIEDNWL
jgi:hypothetical protein